MLSCPKCNVRLDDDVQFCSSCGALVRQQYSGFWRRVAAFLIDGLILSIALAIIALPLSLSNDELFLTVFGILYFGLYFGGPWIYCSAMESSAWQATLGKRAVGIRVTDIHGNRIGFGRATGRYFARILCSLILFFGFLMVVWTQKKQGLHDLMAGTLVVR